MGYWVGSPTFTCCVVEWPWYMWLVGRCPFEWLEKVTDRAGQVSATVDCHHDPSLSGQHIESQPEPMLHTLGCYVRMNGNISHLSKKGRPGFSIQLIQDATTPGIGSQFKHGIGKGEDLFNIPMIQMLFAITTLGNDTINKVHMEGNCTQMFN